MLALIPIIGPALSLIGTLVGFSLLLSTPLLTITGIGAAGPLVGAIILALSF